MTNTVLFSTLFLLVGSIIGWIAAEKYVALLLKEIPEPHEFEDLFQNSPHPELFDAEGNIDRGEYIVINFPPDFNPETDSFFIEDPDEDQFF